MRSLYINLSLLFFCNCNAQDTSIDTKLKSEINTLLNNWHKAASDANFENYFGAMDSMAVFVGTDASEVWSKKKI